MRIVQINTCDNGSTGKIMLDIMSELGNDLEKVAYVSRKYTDNSDVIRMHTRFRYRVHKFLSMYLGLDEWGSYFSTGKVLRQMKKNMPDIIHLHNIHNHTINYRRLFKFIKKYDIPVVWTLHDCWSFTGGCFYFEYNNCYKWQNGCHDCKFLHDAGMVAPIDCTKREYRIKKKSFTGVKRMVLVTPSQWLKNLVEQSYMKEYPVTVINNGINLENFKPTDNHTFDNVVDRSKKILLGVASPFSKRKGFSDFLKLAQIIDKERYQIVLVGVSDEQIQKLPDGVIGIKRTDNQSQLAELYSMAYAFLNFTYEDTFSMVNIEALACGTPVICYKTGGATEMLDNRNSIILGQGKYVCVIEGLDKIEILRNNNRRFSEEIRNKYSSESMTKKYRTLYYEKSKFKHNSDADFE